MILYKNEEIKIRLIEERDIPYVLKYFNENDFNCDFGTGLKPTNYEFKKIMEDIVNNKCRTEAVLVVEKDDKCIGYLSCYVTDVNMYIGHMAVKKEERRNGYGKLLITVALKIAANEDRNVHLTCFYANKSYLKMLGFDAIGSANYCCKVKKEKNSYPTIFMTCEEYRQMAEMESQNRLEDWNNFLRTDLMKHVNLRLSYNDFKC